MPPKLLPPGNTLITSWVTNTVSHWNINYLKEIMTQKPINLQLPLNVNRWGFRTPKPITPKEASTLIRICTNQDIPDKHIRETIKKEGSYQTSCDDGFVIVFTLFQKTDSGRYLLTPNFIPTNFLEVAA